jgi:hypothetical protein
VTWYGWPGAGQVILNYPVTALTMIQVAAPGGGRPAPHINVSIIDLGARRRAA